MNVRRFIASARPAAPSADRTERKRATKLASIHHKSHASPVRAPLAILIAVVYVIGPATGGSLFALLRRSYKGSQTRSLALDRAAAAVLHVMGTRRENR
jgi:hypothetical protein